MGHLLWEEAGDGGVLKVIVDRQAELIGFGGIIGKPFMVGRFQAKQPGHMVGFKPGLLLGRRIRIEIGAERDAQPGAFVCVILPGFVVLVVFAFSVHSLP